MDCMKDNSTFDKDFVRFLIWFILGALLICVFPWLFTQTYFHQSDFSEKGQVGDTIGGIMGPFVAIAAAGLTFIAFYVQYKANIQQRHDIAIERFESNIFEMIHILRLSDEVKMEVPCLKKMWFLDHYYRHLYRLFKYIDDAEENLVDSRKEYEYVCIVRGPVVRSQQSTKDIVWHPPFGAFFLFFFFFYVD